MSKTYKNTDHKFHRRMKTYTKQHANDKPIPLTRDEKIAEQSRQKLILDAKNKSFELSLNGVTLDVSHSFVYIARRFKNLQEIEESIHKNHYSFLAKIAGSDKIKKLVIMGLRLPKKQYKVFKNENGFKHEIAIPQGVI